MNNLYWENPDLPEYLGGRHFPDEWADIFSNTPLFEGILVICENCLYEYPVSLQQVTYSEAEHICPCCRAHLDHEFINNECSRCFAH